MKESAAVPILPQVQWFSVIYRIENEHHFATVKNINISVHISGQCAFFAVNVFQTIHTVLAIFRPLHDLLIVLPFFSQQCILLAMHIFKIKKICATCAQF